MDNSSNLTLEGFYSLSDVCEILQITEETGNNWLKTGKIVPSKKILNANFFSKTYVEKLLKELHLSNNKTLKSRRNKSLLSGQFLYGNYTCNKTRNTDNVKYIIDTIKYHKIDLTDELQGYILAECALQLFQDKNKENNLSKPSLLAYLNGEITTNYNEFIDALILDKVNALKFIKEYFYLFEISYEYSKYDDVLGLLYISTKNLGVRKSMGLYYTPNNVVIKTLKTLFNDDFALENDADYHAKMKMMEIGKIAKGYNEYLAKNLALEVEKQKNASVKQILQSYLTKGEDFKILDPGAGTGNFLLQLPEEITLENIYANDLDEIAVKLTRINLALRHEPKDLSLLYSHVTNYDFLNNEYFDNNKMLFDCILGNPPWGYTFSDEEIIKLLDLQFSVVGKVVKRLNKINSKSIESYDLFVEKSVQMLKEGGELAFVIPEAILNVRSHLAIREYLNKHTTIRHIAYLGDVFEQVACPAIVLHLKKTQLGMYTMGMTISDNKKSVVIKENRKVEPKNFNFFVNDDESKLLDKIANIYPSTFLDGKAIFALGIVTGGNNKYLIKDHLEGYEPILKGCNIFKFNCGKADEFVKFTPDSWQQVAKVEYYRAQPKILYRFVCNQLVFAYDDKKTLSLNSCNIVIPKVEGMDIKYILAILNSRVIQYFWQHTYKSVKVLKNQIQHLPLPRVHIAIQNRTITMVDKLMDTVDKEQRLALYNELDDFITKEIFLLSEDEYKIILDSLGNKNLFLS